MIVSGLCAQAKLDFMRGVHQPGDVYKIALYGASAHLNPLTDKYTTAGEVSGQGYQKGGAVLRGYRCEREGVSAIMTFDDVTWRNATIRAGGALVYNASKGNAALVVIRFLEEIASTNGPFVCPMPPFTAAQALIRLV